MSMGQKFARLTMSKNCKNKNKENTTLRYSHYHHFFRNNSNFSRLLQQINLVGDVSYRS